MKPTEENIERLRISLAISGVNTNTVTCDLILNVIEGIKEKEGEFSIDDASKIMFDIEEKYKQVNPETK